MQTRSESWLPPLHSDDWTEGGFGLYIHWPFCQAKCPYCDFNSHVVGQVDDERWLRAYLIEIERMFALTGPRVLNSVFFGGGTPSLMAPRVVGAILDRIARLWPLANDLEVTLEANPTSTEAAKMDGFRAAGINRVSVGVQALDDGDLRRLGRLHSVGEARNAVATCMRVFDRVSFDLIYARQHQSLQAWETELGQALDMAGDHLSLYQLTIEPGTAFGDRHAIGRLDGLPDEDTAADMFDLTQEMTHAAGFSAYEVSNHARDFGPSRHNLIYWRYGDYAGIGPGAHGRLTLDGQRFATETDLSPLGWVRRVETEGSGETVRDALSSTDQASEYALMSMRLHEGLDPLRFAKLAGRPLDSTRVAALIETGVIVEEAGRIRATRAGRAILNTVLEQLLRDVDTV